ncbi:MAG TPA: hypothetical protein VFQ53_24875 [Kofleriaceae bacterium]|nr:hypothetical protein [Kofleriaceae bacterium]
MGGIVVVLVAACSEHGMSPPMPDVAPPPPPPSGPVSLRIASDGVPHPGVTVVFQAADSHVVGTAVTDASGVASMTMEAGGFVTAIDPFGPPAAGGANDLRTFAGVRPFDELRLGRDDARTGLQVRVTAPVAQNAASYTLHTTCGTGTLVATGTGKPTALVTLQGCTSAVDMIVVANDATGKPLRALIARGLAVFDGDTLQLTGTYEPIASVGIEYSAVPDAYTSIETHATITTQAPILSADATAAVQFGIANTMLALPGFFDTALRIDAHPVPAAPKLGVHGVLTWSSFSTNNFVQLWDLLLPDYAQRPTFSLPRSIFWSETQNGARILDDAPNFESSVPPNIGIPDVVIAKLHVARPDRTFDWTIATPYVGPVVTYPQLSPTPGELAVFDPAPGDAVDVVRLSTVDVPFGYDSVRANILNVVDYAELITDPTFGRISYEDLSP